MIITLIPFLFAIGGAGHPSTGLSCDILWRTVFVEGRLPQRAPPASLHHRGGVWDSREPCLLFEEILFLQILLWPNTTQLMPNI